MRHTSQQPLDPGGFHYTGGVHHELCPRNPATNEKGTRNRVRHGNGRELGGGKKTEQAFHENIVGMHHKKLLFAATVVAAANAIHAPKSTKRSVSSTMNSTIRARPAGA